MLKNYRYYFDSFHNFVTPEQNQNLLAALAKLSAVRIATTSSEIGRRSTLQDAKSILESLAGFGDRSTLEEIKYFAEELPDRLRDRPFSVRNLADLQSCLYEYLNRQMQLGDDSRFNFQERFLRRT